MSRTLEEAILHAEEVANDYEGMIGDYALDSEKLAKCAKNQRQIAEWLRELQARRKEPAIPVAWIEKHIEWLKSLDNEFANLAAAHISVMLKKWRDEPNERTAKQLRLGG